MKKIISRIILGLLVSLGLGTIFSSGGVSAAVVADSNNLYKLSLAQAVEQCYASGARANVSTTESNFPGFGSGDIFNWLWSGGLNNKVFLATTNVAPGSSNNGEVKCSDAAQAVRGRFNVPNNFAGLGYVPSASQSNASTAKAEFRIKDVTFGQDHSGVTSNVSGRITCEGHKQGNNWVVDGCNNSISVNADVNRDGTSENVITLTYDGGIAPVVTSDIQNIVTSYGTDNFEGSAGFTLKSIFAGERSGSTFAAALFGDNTYATAIAGLIRYVYSGAHVSAGYSNLSSNANTNDTEYALINNNRSVAGGVALYNMVGNPSGTGWPFALTHPTSTQDAVSYKWNDNYTYALYYSYLANLESRGYVTMTCSESKPSGWSIQNSSSSWLIIDLRSGMEDAIRGTVVSVVGNYNASLVGGTMADVLTWLSGDHSISNYVGRSGCGADDNGGSATGTAMDYDTVDCDTIVDEHVEGKIGAMQWVLCPAMDNTRYTASWIDNMTQDWLEVDSSLYNNSSAAHEVWAQIRNIANVLMIVFLMVVVVSQLTGYGIDNYGIKKMLPRLIVMAILVNLSFYICEIALDLSNILGEGLRNMFGSFGAELGGQDSLGDITTSFVSQSALALFTAASGGSAAISAGITAATVLAAPVAVAVIIAVIVLALVILVAVVTLFLMLGAREVIMIFCIIVSPLAFACFILPNTQNLFKKWWELFKAALIIFPICGALSGISYLLRQISVNSTLPVWGVAVAMILPYLGFFLIPTLIKNAISALGKVGGALTTMGQTVRNGGRQAAQSAMRVGQNSETYKNLQTEGARRRQMEASQRTIDRLNQIKANGGQLNERQTRRLYEAQQTQNKLTMEQAMADAGAIELSSGVAGIRAESTREAQELKNYSDQYGTLTRTQMNTELGNAVAAYNSDRSDTNALRLQAAIAASEQRGMNKEMLDRLGGLELSAGDENTKDAKILGQLAGSSNKVISQYGKQMGKPASTGERLSMNQFAGSTGNVKMSEAFANQGNNVMNNMDDDTLEYIRNNGRSAASSDMLVNAATSTTNQKELRHINAMLNSASADSINFSGQQLARFDDSTLSTIAERAKMDSDLQQRFVAASNDIANSPELMGTLDQEQRKKISEIRRLTNSADRVFEPDSGNGGGQFGADGAGI